MRIYTAGPMTHIPQFNFPAFDAMADRLRRMGHEVVSPAELDDPEDREAALASPDGSILSYGTGVKKTWGEFLARDVRLIADDGIEAIVVLNGWEKSRGARLETFVGKALCGIPVFSLYISAVMDDDYYAPEAWHYEYELVRVPDIDLFRAWTAEPNLSIHAMYGAVR